MPTRFHRKTYQTATHTKKVQSRSNCVAQRGERVQSGGQTHTHLHHELLYMLTMCAHWKTDIWVCRWRQQGSEAFEWRDLSWKTLTHLPILYKQHADGVLAAEVEYVNVVLNSHLREWLHPGKGQRRTTGGETRSSIWVITFQVPLKERHCWFVCCLLNKRLKSFGHLTFSHRL